VDAVKLTRVFVNIIKNAFEAMPNGGTLTVKSTQTDGNLEISFEDTGLGMSQDTIDKLWTPLFTTKAKAWVSAYRFASESWKHMAEKCMLQALSKKGQSLQ